MAQWLDISVLIHTTLSSDATLVALLSNKISGVKSIHALIAPLEEGDKFITYYLSYRGNPSKDGKFDYTVVINSFAPTYDDALKIADKVIATIKAAPDTFKLISGKTVLNDQNEFYIEQIFNIKK